MRTWPPILRALLALLGAWALLMLVAREHLLPSYLSPLTLVFLMGLLTAGLGLGLGLPRGWVPFLALAPWFLDWLLRRNLPPWVWLAALVLSLLVYGGGVRTRVPLYNSNRAAWRELEALLPLGLVRFADLGAGLGGPLVHLARKRPDGFFLGVETSPLTCLIAWLRALPVRGHCKVHWGSLWNLDLGGYEVVYAFLSPAPMPDLWIKARQEMRPGTLLVSNTFAVPGVAPERRIDLPGRRDACLLVYRMPGSEA